MLNYVVEMMYNVIMPAYYVLITLTLLTLFISTCQYHRTFYTLFCAQIDEINEIHEPEHQEQQQQKQHRYDAKKLLKDSITFHISAKE